MACVRWRLASAAVVAVRLLVAVEGSSFAQADGPIGSDALAAGRALFAEALADEDAGRFGLALDKFVRVKAVRDTAPVEYRIGTCQEGLGRLASAYTAYRAAMALGDTDAAQADVVQAARGRADVLSKRIARLTLVVPPGPHAALTIDVDDAAVAPGALGQPLALDPGTHAVMATSDRRVAFRSTVALPPGGEASLPIVLAGDEPPTSPVETKEPPRAHGHALGWILVGAGAALLAGAGVTWVLRHGDIATLDSACPAGACPPGADRSSLESTRSRAVAEGPIAGTLAAVGVVVSALGVVEVAW